MLISSLALIVGFLLLIWSADRFVIGASATASILGVSPLVIGILVVGIGTSAPEMLVSAIAAFDGQTGLSLGNALGSNITNIALILGITALVIPLQVQSQILKRELPLLLFTMILGLFLLWDGHLGRGDGIILLAGFALVVLRQLWEAKRSREDVLAGEYERQLEGTMSLGRAVFWLLLGFVLLVGSARLLVWGAVDIAVALGVSDLIIGLTIVAIGTSLPELAASLAAARKGEHDIALGNVIGSNLFNLLGVMALPGVIAPGVIDEAVMWRDYPLMLGLTVLLIVFAWSRPGRSRVITRTEGGILLLVYLSYLGYLIYSSL